MRLLAGEPHLREKSGIEAAGQFHVKAYVKWEWGGEMVKAIVSRRNSVKIYF